MKKKFLSVLLTGAMVIGSCVVSFADPTMNGTEATTLDAGSDIQKPTISVGVTLPTGDATKLIKANPYKLAIGSGDDAVNDSLIGTSYTITNSSNCEISLSVNGIITVEGGTKVATSATAAETATTPTAFVQAFLRTGTGDDKKYLKVNSKTKALEEATGATDENPYGDATPLVYAAKSVAYTGNVIMQRAAGTDKAVVYVDITGATGGVGWTDSTTFKASTVLNVAPSTSAANISNGADD